MDRLSFRLRHRLAEQPPGARVNAAMDGYRQKAEYIDFIVNGQSLADLFKVDERDLISMLRPEDVPREAPSDRQVFNHFKRPGMLYYELAMRLPCRYEFRRVHLYGCPECGDLYCGSVTAQLIETDSTVIWRRFDNGREENANYMSEDKSYSGGDLYDLWLSRGRDYAVLDAFGLSGLENDYEFVGAFRYNKMQLDAGADLRRGEVVTVEYPEVGPFEFDKVEYLAALAKLRDTEMQKARREKI